jgi:hypothetical protein
MRIFVSYSFRPENKWVDDYVIPLIRCFGHEPVTGDILEDRAIPDEVRDKIKGTKRVLCFMTRADPIYGQNGAISGYAPPDWVRDELMLGRGAEKVAIEFREEGVIFGGAAHFSASHAFDRDKLPALLLRLAKLLKDWPVGPLVLRLTVPQALQDKFSAGVAAGTLQAKCTARDSGDDVVFSEVVPVRNRNDQFVIPILIKPDPNLAIEIEIAFGLRSKLVSTGISPAVCIAPLRQL